MRSLQSRQLMASTCLAALVCVTAGGSAGAQDRPAASGPLWGAHADIVGRTAQEHSAAGVEFFIPLLQNQDSMIFIDAGINGDFDSEVYGTFGLGYRKIVTPDLILGGIVAVDVTRTDDENTFGAISLGAEAIGTSAEARINVQLPFSGARRIFDETVAISQPGTLTLLDNRLVEQAANRRITVDEVPLSGVEGEIGVNLPIGFDRLDDQLKAFAGAYHYGGDGVDSFTGVSGRLEYSVRDIMGDKLPGAELILSAGLTHDDEHGTNFAGEARLRIPLGAPVRTAANARTLSPLEERMTQRVVRTTRIHTSERTRSQVGSFAPRVVTDPLTGRPLEAIYFADGADKFGKGTADDPTTLADAVQRAGAGGTVVAEGNNGTIDTPGVALASGQRLVGGGVAIPVQLADGTITSFQLGQIAPVIVGVPTANTITLAANNRLQSLTITGGLNGIAGTNVEALALQQITIGGSAVAGISIVNDAGTNTLSVDGLSVSGVGGPGVAVNGLGGGSTTVTGFSGVTVASAGGGGVLFDGVTFDADRRMPGFQRVAAGGLTIGDQTNPAAIRGDGLRLNQVAGDLAFTSLLIANADGAGLFIRDSGGPGGDFSFGNTGGAIRTAGGAALDVDPVLLAARFGTVSSINAARQGSGGADGVFLDRILARDSGAPALVIDTLSISGAAGNGLVATNNAGNLVFGATSITNVGGTGIVLANNAGTVTFADTAIANPGAGGIDIAGINGRVGFGNVDITGLGAGKGLDLTDAPGYASTRVALAFQTLDITGTGVAGSVGIDYSGTTNIFDVTTADSGRISGVGIGIDLRNAAATGLFQYGDGSAADADGRASLITAARPLEIAGLNAATGLYNLRDVAFAGDISNISGVTVFYVDADGGNNPAIADGTAEDPGTLAQAAASGADVIALVDNQIAGQDVIDAGAAIQGAPGSLTLGDGQRLISFLNEDLVDTGGGRGVPANLLLTGIDANIVRNPRTGSGAPRLTTTEGGRNTLVLGNNNTLTGVVIDNGAGAAAVFGNGIGGLTFRNSQLSSIGLTATGGTGRLENLAIGQLAVTGGSIALVGSNADIAQTGSGAALSVGGGHTGSITFDAASSISASSGIGLRFNQANGIYDFGGPFTLGGGANIAFSGAAGRLSFADTTIGNPVGNGIDLAGTNGAISFGNVAISGVAAGAVALDFNGAALTGAFSARSLVATGAGGTPPAGSIGIDLRGVTGGQTIRIGVSPAPDPAADTPSRLENFATGVFVDAASNAVFTYGDGEDAADRASRIRATTPINAASAPTLGSYNFLDVDFEGASPGAGFVPATVYYFSETGTGSGATQSDPGSIGGAEASGADLLVPIGTTTINAANGGGGGSLDLASAQQLRGFDTAGGTLAAGFTGPPTIQISALSATISDVTGSGSPTLTTSAAGQNVVNLASGNTLSFISTTGGASGIAGSGINNLAARNVSVAGTSGAGIALAATSGNIAFTGTTSVTASGGAGVSVAATGGTISFATLSVNNAGTAGSGVSISGPGSFAFTNGLAIATTSGAGFTASGGGTISVAAAGTRQIATTTGQILSLNGVTIGTGGVSFASLASSGTVAADAINLTGVAGGSFNGGAVTIAGTSGATSDGIEIVNSAASFGFGAVSVANVAARGIALTGANGAVSFASIAITGGAGRGVEIFGATNNVTINGGSIGPAVTAGFPFRFVVFNQAATSTISLSNVDITGDAGSADLFNVQNSAGTITVTGGTFSQASAQDTVGISGGSAAITIGANLVQSGTGNAVKIDGTSGTIVFNGTIGNSGGGRAFDIGSSTAVVGGSITFNGAITDTGSSGVRVQNLAAGAAVAVAAPLTVINATADALSFANNAGTLSFAGVTASTTGTARAIAITGAAGSATYSFNGQVTLGQTGSTGAAVAISGAATHTVSFLGGLGINDAAGAGFTASGGATINVPAAGASQISTKTGQILNLNGVTIGAGGMSFVGLASIDTVAADAINITGVTGGSFAGGTVTIAGTSGAGSDGIEINGSSATFGFGTTTIGQTGGNGILLSANGGAVSFADTTIFVPLGNGIDLAGTNGAISFGNVAITGVAAGAVALDLNGAALTGAFSARSLVASGAGGTPPAGSIGVDLRGATGGQTIRIGVSPAPNPATDTPSRLQNFATGVFVDAASNAVFTFGDGEDATDQASRIRATTRINAASAPTLGSYNFLDVDFEGASPGAGFVPATVYYFSETGTGSGATQSDPGSIGGAEASGADLLVPIGTTTINAANGGGGGSLDLAGAQQLRGFQTAGGTLDAGFASPPTIQISAISATISDLTGNGSPTLTTSAAGQNVVNLASGNTLSFISTTGGASGIAGSGINNLAARNVSVAGTSGAGIALAATSGNIAFTGTTSVTASGGTGVSIAATGGTISFATLSVNNAGATPTAGGGVSISGPGSFDFTNGLAIATTSGAGFTASGGGTISVAAVGTRQIATTTGQILNLSGVTIGAGGVSFASLASSGVVAADAINLTGVAGGSFHGGAVTIAGTSGAGADGIEINGSGAAFSFGATTIDNATSRGIALLGANGAVSFATIDIDGVSGNGVYIFGVTNDVTINGGSIGATNPVTAFSFAILNQTATSTISLSNVDITGRNGSPDLFNVQNSAGTITVTGGTFSQPSGNDTVDITGGNATITIGANLVHTGTGAIGGAVEIDGTSGTIVFNGSITNSGGARAFDIGAEAAVTAGSITFNGAISDTGSSGVRVQNLAAGAAVAVAAPLSVINASADALSFTNNAGTLSFAGVTASATGAARAIAITGAAGSATYSFNGQVTLGQTGSTGAAVSISGAATHTVSFLGGLSIDAATGAGFNASGGATINVAAAGTRQIATTTGQILNLSGVTIGTSGVSFASLGSSGVVAADAINLTGVAGGSFHGGAVSIAGTSGATSDGIEINGSSATFNFTSAAIANAAANGLNLDGANGAVSFGSVTIDGSGGAGIRVAGTTATVDINGGSVGGTTVNVGPGVQVENTLAGSDVTFRFVDVTANGADAYTLSNNAGGVTTIFGSATQTGAGDGLDISGGSGTVCFGSDITHSGSGAGDRAVRISGTSGDIQVCGSQVTKTNGGLAVEITGTTGGAIRFDAAVNASVGAGGVAIGNNSGGSTTFANTVTLSTGAADGVTLTNNDPAYSTAFDSGLEITTTSGRGFAATNGGTLSVAAAGTRSISTVTGRILDWNGLIVGGGNVAFQSLGPSGTVAGDAILLSNVDGGAFSGGAVTIAGTSVGGDGIEISGGSSASFDFTSATISNAAGNGLNLNGANGAVSFGSVDLRSSGSAGIRVFGNTAAVTISGGTVGAGASNVGALLVDGGTGAVTVAANLTNSSGTGVSVVNRGAGAGTVSITGTLTQTGTGLGVNLANAGGTTSFGNTLTLNGSGGGITATNTGGTTNFAAVNVTQTGAGPGISISAASGSATYSFNGQATLNQTGSTGGAMTISGAATHTVSFLGGLAINAATGAGFTASGGATINVAASGTRQITTATGQILTLNGVTIGTGISFGSLTATGTVAGDAINLTSIIGTGTFGGGAVSIAGTGPGSNGIAVSGSGLNTAIGFGQTTIGATGANGIALTLNAGSVGFTGITTINNPGFAGVRIGGANGAISFADLKINLGTANTTGLGLSGTPVASSITAGDFDVNGGGFAGTLGINLVGATGTGTIQLGNTINNNPAPGGQTSTITNVARGVLFSSATSLGNFVFGDGAAPAESAISTIGGVGFAIAATDTLPLSGNYNFLDADLSGSDVSNLASSITYYYVDNVGTGDGSRFNRGSIAGAAGSTAQVIVLVDNGGAGADTITAGATLALGNGRALVSFRNGTVDLTELGFTAGGAPSNFLLTGITTGGTTLTDPTGGGAPVLTTTAAAPTVTLAGAGSNGISGVVIENGGGGAGISGSNISSLILQNSTVSGGAAASGVSINSNTTTNLSLANLTLRSGTGAPALSINGTGGTTTITRFSGLTVEGGAGTGSGIAVTAATFDADTATGGYQPVAGGNSTIGSGGRVNGNGLAFTNVLGRIDYGTLIIANDSGTGLLVQNPKANDFTLTNTGGSVDTTNGTAVNLDPLTVGLTFGSVDATGGANGIVFDQVAGTFNVTGATSVTGTAGYGITAINTNTGTFTFNTLTVNNGSTAGGGINLASGTLNFAGNTNLTTAGGTGINQSGGTIASTAGTLAVSTGAGTGIATTGGSLTATNVGNTLNSTAGAAAILNGSTANLLFFSTSSGGTPAANISLTNVAGSLDFGNGSLVGSTGTSVLVNGGTAGVSYAGSITSGTGQAVEINGRTGAPGAITLSSPISHNVAGARGIYVHGNSGGTITFSGPTKLIATTTANAVELATNTGATIAFTNGGLAVATSSGTGFSANGGGRVAVTGVNNTITTGTGILQDISDITIGVDGISFASQDAGVVAGGAAIRLNALTEGNYVGGTVTIGGTTGGAFAGIDILGASDSSITFGTTTIGGAATTGGAGIAITGSANVRISEVRINNTTGAGIAVTGNTGAIDIQGGEIGDSNDPTAQGVVVTGGDGNVNILTNNIRKTTAGRIIEVSGRTGGTVTFFGSLNATGAVNNGILVQNNTGGTVTFSHGTKTLTTGANTAVTLANNTGATVNFINGALAISTTSGAGFSATGGGTVTLTTPTTGPIPNSLTSTTGTALNVVNTTIGASGLTFQSISSNGGTNGIVLNNTGALGGLTVTGDGGALNNGSGGVIQNTTGDGISLTSTAGVRLARMNVNNNLGDGIGGSNVNGLLIERLNISGNGDSAAADESGINIAELTGSAFGGTNPTGIVNSVITNNHEFQVQITNTAGTLTDFRLTDNTISSNGTSGTIGNLVNFLGLGSATMTLNASGGSYTGAAPNTATGIQADHSGSSGTVTANVTGGTFTNNNVAVSVSVSNGGNLNFDVNGITATGNRSHGLNFFVAANSTGNATGTFQNNSIGTLGVVGSGSSVGNGISIQNEGSVASGVVTLRIHNNTIREVANFTALNVNSGIVSQPATKTLNVTITANTISNVNNSRAIVVQQNNTTAPGILNASISGNILDLATISGLVGDGTVIRLRQLAGGTFNLTQAAPTGAANPAELDDANNFNDPLLISISGTINYNQPAPPLP